MRSAKRLRAFTLIELLVVVAIIAILMAVLLPSLANAKMNARSTVCLTHMREIGRCFWMYAQDNDNAITTQAPGPISTDNSASTTTTSTYYWCYSTESVYPSATPYGIAISTKINREESLFSPYFRSTGIYQCPEAVSMGIIDAMTGSDNIYAPAHKSLHYAVPRTMTPYATNMQIKLTRFKHPTETILALESSNLNTTTGVSSSYMYSDPNWTPNTYTTTNGPITIANFLSRSTPTFQGRHGKKGNVLWVDGHVESIKPLLSTVPTYFPSAKRPYLENYRAANYGYIQRTPEDMANAANGLWYYYFDRDAKGVFPALQ